MSECMTIVIAFHQSNYRDFKLHLLINHIGEIISVSITQAGNTNDRIPVPNQCKNLTGKLYADKGDIGKN